MKRNDISCIEGVNRSLYYKIHDLLMSLKV